MLLGRYFPGHIHAFYLVYTYYHRRSQSHEGTLTGTRAPFIFSDRIQSGGMVGYGTMTVYPVSEKAGPGAEPLESAAEPMGSGPEPMIERPVKT